MVGTRSGKDHASNPPPTKRGRGRGTAQGGRARSHNQGTPSRLVDTPSKHTNADDSILTSLGPSPQQSVGGRHSDIQSDEGRLPERQELRLDGFTQIIPQAGDLVVPGSPEIPPVEGDIGKTLGRWNPYTEHKHIKVLENNKKDIKVNKETEKKKPYKIPKIDRSNPKALGLKPYERKPKSGSNKWKETFKMEVKDAIEE
ncbi:hypothetical protein PTTG_09978 [Puccinia triticina 1-1 BBBD Race 1]|uniref:Uncharacterized protein n=1 Tax=Puccinia triticina (isolate 1-1 / race 1 (BBBD)) TaxID=630390 RepID=A0A180H156_PUCT1|nr:hypothetical protein PTTG_09978 [Puccinia triticina 1-1 BBBD Race 1]